MYVIIMFVILAYKNSLKNRKKENLPSQKIQFDIFLNGKDTGF